MKWKPFENKHLGERCFILGNAPSLADEDLTLLKGEKVFITNRGQKAKDIGLDHFDYHVVSDITVYNDYCKEFQKSDEGTKFYNAEFMNLESYQGEDFVPLPPKKYEVTGLMRVKKFPTAYTNGWSKTGNIVLTASLVAYFMGFAEIYILGTEWIYKKNSTHFYKDTSERENSVLDGHKTKGYKYLSAFVEFFRKKNVKFVNLSKKFAYKDMMDTGNLEEIIPQ